MNVLLPTPPFPLNTKILRFTVSMRARTRARSGSGPLGAVAHICWLGHPSQAEALPAVSLSVPLRKSNKPRISQRPGELLSPGSDIRETPYLRDNVLERLEAQSSLERAPWWKKSYWRRRASKHWSNFFLLRLPES